MSFVQSYPFGTFAPGPGTYDQVVQKPYPGLILNGTEPSGLYYEIREINGELWFIQNATFAGNEFTPVNGAVAAFSFKVSSTNELVFMSGGTGVNPITWTVTFSFPFSGTLTVNALDVITSAIIGTTLNVGSTVTAGGPISAPSYKLGATTVLSEDGVNTLLTPFTVGGTVGTVGPFTVGTNLDVNGNSAMSGSLGVGVNLTVGGNSSSTGSTSVGTNLMVAGNAVVLGELFANSAAITTSFLAGSIQSTSTVDATSYELTNGATTAEVMRTDGTATFITAFNGGFTVFEATPGGMQLLVCEPTQGNCATAGGVFPNGTNSFNTPALYSGEGVPAFAAMNGSMYMRTDGTMHNLWYLNRSGPNTVGAIWTPDD